MAASAVVPYARPMSPSENFNVWLRYVYIVTYQDPQIKYWRNIINERRMRIEVFIY